MVSLAAGRMPDCKLSSKGKQRSKDPSPPLAVDFKFSEIRGIAFSSHGELFISESDVIWIRRSDGRLHRFAGTRSSLPWSPSHTTVVPRLLSLPRSPSFDQLNIAAHLVKPMHAQDFRFSNISAISVGVFNELFVADSGHNVVLVVQFELPRKTEAEKFEIVASKSEELIFNKHGQPESIVDALTQYVTYSLEFKTTLPSGWLSEVKQGTVDTILTLKRNARGLPERVILNTGKFRITCCLFALLWCVVVDGCFAFCL